jgi:2',3'-cyclic-nucleotide 2'-phosphodiesterase (5'-nucleotidase family)
MSSRKRTPALIVTSTFLLVVVGAMFSSRAGSARNLFQTQNPKPQDREALARSPAPTGTLKDRLATDDGYAAVLFYSADIHGNLEVCGCPIHPLGGVARRLGYIDAFRERSPDAATMLVDAGHIFSDDLTDKGELRADARLMNDWVMRAGDQMNMEVSNLSYRDLPYLKVLLRPGAGIAPAKTSLISANIHPADSTPVVSTWTQPAPYVIKTVTARRLARPLRIAFIGLSDRIPDELKDSAGVTGFTIDDPAEAAKKALAAVRDKADVTVVLGYFKLATANKLALQNEDLDIIIAADGRGLVPDPKQVNNTLIVYAANQTKHLGELRFYADAEGSIDKFTNRYVELDEVIPDEPQMATMTKAARTQIDAVQTKMAEEETAAMTAKGSGSPQAAGYVTSEACAKCHQAEYAVWQKSRHFGAFAALEKRQRTFDPACVTCHSVGFQRGGFINIKATPQFANVQCESCHGPGAQHIKAPAAGNYKTPAAPASCVVCHDRENSPDFVFERYWPVVAHGAPARNGRRR